MGRAKTLPHTPVLLNDFLDATAPISGTWIDGTFGAGGYSRALLDAGADRVIAIDCDPFAIASAQRWAAEYGDRLVLVHDKFSNLHDVAQAHDALPVAGVILDIGVSSMQIDERGRGFSYRGDGPLDMRMAQTGFTAADIVNKVPEAILADILYLYGEERKSFRIASNIVKERDIAPIESTRQLSAIIKQSLLRPRPHPIHPATRSFQALRIAVNDELGQLVAGLQAAESALAVGGILAVISFHSLEDRIVKRFIQTRGAGVQGNRHQPEVAANNARFEPIGRKALRASPEECKGNPRARSAKMRLARRLENTGESVPIDPVENLSMPFVNIKKWL